MLTFLSVVTALLSQATPSDMSNSGTHGLAPHYTRSKPMVLTSSLSASAQKEKQSIHPV